MTREETGRTVVLLRCSSDKQDEEFASQRIIVNAWLVEHGVEVAPEDWREEYAVCGTSRDRPVLDRIFAECEAGEVSRVICSDFTRAGRSGFRTCVMIEDLLELKVRVVFIVDRMSLVARERSRPDMSPLMFSEVCTLAGLTLGAVAKLEIVSPTTAAGMKRAKANGRHVGHLSDRWPPESDAALLSRAAAGESVESFAHELLVLPRVAIDAQGEDVSKSKRKGVGTRDGIGRAPSANAARRRLKWLLKERASSTTSSPTNA